MLNRLPTPTQMPPLGVMLDDIGSHTLGDVAKALDVGERKLKRWIEQDNAPRAVLLAVFWITRWGMSAVHCDAHNAAVLQANIAAGLRSEVNRLHAQLAWLTSISQFGSANAPTMEVHAARLHLTLVQPPGEPPAPKRKARPARRRTAGKP